VWFSAVRVSQCTQQTVVLERRKEIPTKPTQTKRVDSSDYWIVTTNMPQTRYFFAAVVAILTAHYRRIIQLF